MMLTHFWIIYFAFQSIAMSQISEPCFDKHDATKNEILLTRTRQTSLEGFPCQIWRDMAFGDYDQDYSEVEDNNCRALRPHGEKFGPWCFIGNADMPTVPEWQPCFPTCQDLQLDRNESFCYWPIDFPKSELDYYGRRTQAYNPEELSNPVSCAPWPIKYRADENVTSKLCRSRNDGSDPDWIIPWCYYLDQNQVLTAGECFLRCEIMLQFKENIATEDICIPGKRIREERLDTIQNFKCRKNISINGFPCKTGGQQPLEIDPQIFKELGPYCEIDHPHFSKEPCYDRCEDRVGNHLYDKSICVGLDKLLSYRGTKRTSLSNKQCLHWKDPLNSKWVAESGKSVWKQLRAREEWMSVNFCRNPNADLNGPWCFVKDSSVPVREYCFKHCRYEFEVDREMEVEVTQNETRYFEEMLEWLKQNRTRKDSDDDRKIDIQKYVIYAGSALGGLIVLYVIFVVIGIFSYEWMKTCFGYRDLLEEMKEVLEEGPDDPNQEVLDAYMKVLEEYKKLLNVAKHSYSGRLLEGWEEFDDVNAKIQRKPVKSYD